MFQDLKHQKAIATIKPYTKPSKPKYIRKLQHLFLTEFAINVETNQLI